MPTSGHLPNESQKEGTQTPSQLGYRKNRSVFYCSPFNLISNKTVKLFGIVVKYEPGAGVVIDGEEEEVADLLAVVGEAVAVSVAKGQRNF